MVEKMFKNLPSNFLKMSPITIHNVEVQTMVVEKDGGHLGIVVLEAVHERGVPHQVGQIAISSAVITENFHTVKPGLRVQHYTGQRPKGGEGGEIRILLWLSDDGWVW